MAKVFSIKNLSELDQDAINRLYKLPDTAYFIDQVNAGRGAAFEVIENGKRVSIFILRSELMKDGLTDMVIAFAEGLASFPLCEVILPVIERFARYQGCDRCRFETNRHGLVAKFAKLRRISCSWDMGELAT